MKPPESHRELIKCPRCGEIVKAKVEHTSPFFTYLHECKCGYLITESDWELAESEWERLKSIQRRKRVAVVLAILAYNALYYLVDYILW